MSIFARNGSYAVFNTARNGRFNACLCSSQVDVAVKKDGPHDLCGGTDHAACVALREVKLFDGLLEFSIRLSCYI